MKSTSLRRCSLFIFDLDGTLINSRADIAYAMNMVLGRMNLKGLPESRVGDFVGNGLQKLVERSLREILGREPESELVKKSINLFKEEYAIHLLDHTRLYPGVTETLDRLHWGNFAVVSNKPEAFSRSILEGLGVHKKFCAILGGDSVNHRKPDPEALFRAMEVCKASPSETAMIGDSGVDIQAGKAAGTATCGVLWGFRPREELEDAGCDLLVQSFPELADHFRAP